MARAARHRNLHDERSEETRNRLLDATLESLIAVGYVRTSTTEIAERAGVSRGAQVYHFPTKAALVSAAVERLLEHRHEELRQLAAQPMAGSVDAALGFLWRIFDKRLFSAWIELVVASRTEPGLRVRVARMSDDFRALVRDTLAELFPDAVENPVLASIDLTFAMLSGLALKQILYDDSTRSLRMLDELRDIAYVLQSDAAPAARKTARKKRA